MVLADGGGLKVSEFSIALFNNPPQQLGMSELWIFCSI